MKIKHFIGYGFLISIILLLLNLSSDHHKTNVTIINQSNTSIETLTVSLSSNSAVHTIKGIKTEGSISLEFYDFPDSHYVLTGKLENSKNISEEVGYICPGIDSNDTIIINSEGSVSLKRKTPITTPSSGRRYAPLLKSSVGRFPN